MFSSSISTSSQSGTIQFSSDCMTNLLERAAEKITKEYLEKLIKQCLLLNAETWGQVAQNAHSRAGRSDSAPSSYFSGSTLPPVPSTLPTSSDPSNPSGSSNPSNPSGSSPSNPSDPSRGSNPLDSLDPSSVLDPSNVLDPSGFVPSEISPVINLGEPTLEFPVEFNLDVNVDANKSIAVIAGTVGVLVGIIAGTASSCVCLAHHRMCKSRAYEDTRI